MRLAFVVSIVGITALLTGCAGSGSTVEDRPLSVRMQSTKTPIDEPTTNADMRLEPTFAITGDADCIDFSTHREAQAFFIAEGGPALDPHRLDRDHDGIACELS